MPKREHFVDFLDGLPHIETQLYYPVLDGLGILNQARAKEEMAQAPQVRAYARKTVDSLVKEYKQAAGKAMGHAEFLAYVRENR
jgi:tryptophan halogenase